ncbi:hypothetical protein GCM10010269_50860 [Streptomyces humidus]|uniref:Uncharacterized protein n=1 Tax=Streptomyces humidus TaxID=52259 RepID=A0A918L5W2_9ACTN|nr:hypothetical protein GCM10010269_50860 [Streptomyces humidus]
MTSNRGSRHRTWRTGSRLAGLSGGSGTVVTLGEVLAAAPTTGCGSGDGTLRTVIGSFVFETFGCVTFGCGAFGCGTIVREFSRDEVVMSGFVVFGALVGSGVGRGVGKTLTSRKVEVLRSLP